MNIKKIIKNTEPITIVFVLGIFIAIINFVKLKDYVYLFMVFLFLMCVFFCNFDKIVNYYANKKDDN